MLTRHKPFFRVFAAERHTLEDFFVMRRRLAQIIGGLLLGLVGCSAGTTRVIASNDDAGDVEGSSSSSDAGVASSDASGTVAKLPLNPIREGYTWTWQSKVKNEGGEQFLRDPFSETILMERTDIGGRRAYGLRSSWEIGIVHYVDVDKDDVDKRYLWDEDSQSWKPFALFPLPVEEGAHYEVPYENTLRKYTWHRQRDPIVVPAGTFDGECWVLEETVLGARPPQAVVSESQVVYCRGVGRVLASSKTPRGYEERTELISKKL